MKKILIFILGIFMFSSLVSYSAEVYETASADFMNAIKILVISYILIISYMKKIIGKSFK